MMKIPKKDMERLSAYLDGESADPEADRVWIASDHRLSALCREYESLSAEVKGLPPADVSPSFRTRVMAVVRDADRPVRFPWWRPAVLAVPAIILVVSAVSWFTNRPTPASSEWTRAANIERMEGIVVEKIAEAPPESGDDIEPFYVGDDLTWGEATGSWDMTTLLSEINDVLDEETSMDSLLVSLTESEKSVLKELLIAQAIEEFEI